MTPISRSIKFLLITFVFGIVFCSQIVPIHPISLIASTAQAQKEAPKTSAKDQDTTANAKKVLMVIAPKNFRDEELFRPKEIIEKAGYRVVIASTSTKEAVGMLGGKTKPDIILDEAKVSDYEAVVFVGGSGTRTLLNHPKALHLAKSFEQAGKLVTAICMAPEILANAGLLKGKRATSWKGGHANLKAKGAKLSKKRVEQDGRIITGNGPSAATRFGETIVQSLAKK